jgi:hypothetical protein
MLHCDHIVGAFIAYLRAAKTGRDTILPFLGQRSVVLMHGVPPSRVMTNHKAMRRLKVSDDPSVSITATTNALEAFSLDRGYLYRLSVRSFFFTSMPQQTDEGPSPT